MTDLQMTDARLLSEMPNLATIAKLITWLELKINYDVMVTLRAADMAGCSVLQISFHYAVWGRGKVLRLDFPQQITETEPGLAAQSQWLTLLLDTVNTAIKHELAA